MIHNASLRIGSGKQDYLLAHLEMTNQDNLKQFAPYLPPICSRSLRFLHVSFERTREDSTSVQNITGDRGNG